MSVVEIGRTTVDALCRALELDMVLGRLRPRERLVEDDLMDRYSAKRHHVRAALGTLKEIGLVERRPNRGAHVREYGASEVRELYALRETLHALAVQGMILPLPDAGLVVLSGIADRHEAAIADGRLGDVIALNDAFHDALFGHCGNRFLAEAIHNLGLRSKAIRSYRIGDAAMLRQAAEEHRAMIEAVRHSDARTLTELCADHILPSMTLYLADRGTARGPDVASEGARIRPQVVPPGDEGTEAS